MATCTTQRFVCTVFFFCFFDVVPAVALFVVLVEQLIVVLAAMSAVVIVRVTFPLLLFRWNIFHVSYMSYRVHGSTSMLMQGCTCCLMGIVQGAGFDLTCVSKCFIMKPLGC